MKNRFKTAKKKPADFETTAAQIRAHLEKEEWAPAYRLLHQIEKEHAENPAFWLLLARYYALRKEIAEASAAFEHALQLTPTDTAVYLEFANFLYGAEQMPEAKAVIRRGIELSKDSGECYRWLEGMLAATRDIDGYRQFVDEVLARPQERDWVLKWKAAAASRSRAVITTIDFYRECLDAGLEHSHVYYMLADLLAFIGDIEAGEHFLRMAIAKDATDPRYFDLLASIYQGPMGLQNEQLVVAAAWKQAVLREDLRNQMNHRWWGMDSTTMEEILHLWGRMPMRDDPMRVAYRHLAEFYRREQMHNSGRVRLQCDPVKALEACVAQLAKRGDDRYANLYRGWLHYFRQEHKDAAKILAAARKRVRLSHEHDHDIDMALTGLTKALELEQASDEPTQSEASGPPTPKELLELGFVLGEGDRLLQRKPAVGLDRTIEHMLHVMTGEGNRSILLTGPSGIGKTAAIQSLAWRLLREDCPEPLKSFRVFQTSTTRLLAGAKYIGTWQQRLEAICTAASRAKNFVIYIEDIENIIAAGSHESDSSSFVDYLLPRMQSNEIILVGELDAARLQMFFTREPRLESVLNEIRLEEPTGDKLTALLRESAGSGLLGPVTVTESALQEAIALTELFQPYRAFPGKAIDLLRRAGELFRGANPSESVKIDQADITLAFCDRSGVPDFIVDSRQSLDTSRMQSFFSDRVLGQHRALAGLGSAVEAFKARLTDPRRPIRSMLFVGPTGVGKTEAAKVLAEYLFGSQDRMIRLNMSEYSGPWAVDKLLSAPGEKATRSTGFLDRVRRQPFSVLLLDEIEKASPEVLNLLLQLLDDGTLADARGRQAYFHSAIIIMTSNIGSRRYTAKSIGFDDSGAGLAIEQNVLADVKEFFSPEIYNRFDEVICFQPLSREVLGTIINRETGKVLRRRGVIERGITIDVDRTVRDHILATGYDPRYGARNIRRAVEAAVALPLARLLAAEQVPRGQLVRVNMRGGAPVAEMAVTAVHEPLPPAAVAPPRLAAEILAVPQKDVARVLTSLAARIDGLKTRFKFDEARASHEEFQRLMVQPTFWDDPKAANRALRRYADLNRLVERVHRWEDTCQNITATVRHDHDAGRPSDLPRLNNTLVGLLNDLESAEMEILLEGRHDRADAFVLLRTTDPGREAQKWLTTVAGVYSAWARRRSYRYQFLAENFPTSGHGTLLLHISGLNAFGLLKNERGIHRRTVEVKSGSKLKGGARSRTEQYDCHVLVLADVQSAEESEIRYSLKVKTVSPAQHGVKIRRLSRFVKLEHRDSRTDLELYTDVSIDKDRRVFGDMFLSYIHCRENGMAGMPHGPGAALAGGPQGVWGSLVRTFEQADRARVVDHASRITITNARDYLTGKIDALLLERLL